MLMHTGSQPIHSRARLLTTAACDTGRGREYALEGSVFIGGAVVQWLRDGLKIVRAAAEIEALAASVPDNGGVIFVPAFVGLGAPYWDAYARGTIVGIERSTTRGHLARAALEAMSLQTLDVVEAMERDSGVALRELRVDGGASVNDLLMQYQADVLGKRVRRPVVNETTALGAAYLAGLGVGFWKDQADVERNWALDQEFQPKMKVRERQATVARWRRAVERSRAWAASG
jgi:glycerol kinase